MTTTSDISYKGLQAIFCNLYFLILFFSRHETEGMGCSYDRISVRKRLVMDVGIRRLVQGICLKQRGEKRCGLDLQWPRRGDTDEARDDAEDDAIISSSTEPWSVPEGMLGKCRLPFLAIVVV